MPEAGEITKLLGQLARVAGASQQELLQQLMPLVYGELKLLSSVEPAKAQGREVTVAEVLDQAAERLQGETALADQPAVEAAVRLTIGNTYRALGDFSEAKTHFERALEIRRAASEGDAGTPSR